MASITFIIMVKNPLDARIGVKTRLAAATGMDDRAIRKLAMAMLRCLFERVSGVSMELGGRVILAVTPDDSAAELAAALGCDGDMAIGQGTGALGARMARAAGGQRTAPVVFLGMDSPDLPIDVLRGLPGMFHQVPLAIGPTPDGGYWILAAAPEVDLAALLDTGDIDWGSPAVYDQTRAALKRLGVGYMELPIWADTDNPADLALLVERLQHAAEPALTRLRDTLMPMTPDVSHPHTHPPATSAPAPTSSPSGTGVDLSGASILLVDDNEQNIELMQAYLEALPCTIHIATDGVEAVEQIDRLHPDLVLLDVMMPRMSGFEVCRQVKSDPALRDISIIMVTALNEVGDIERAVECGTNDFLTKPVNKIELLTRVRSQLELRIITRQYNKLQKQMGTPEVNPRAPGVDPRAPEAPGHVPDIQDRTSGVDSKTSGVDSQTSGVPLRGFAGETSIEAGAKLERDEPRD